MLSFPRRVAGPQRLLFVVLAGAAACGAPDAAGNPTETTGDAATVVSGINPGPGAGPGIPPPANVPDASSDSGSVPAAPSPIPDAGADSSTGANGCPTFDSSFAAIQKVIFEGHGCTAAACHGDAKSGGLDLRPDVAFENLVNVKSSNSSLARVQPGTATDSFLYQKLAAATNPAMTKTTGSPMPVGAAPLSAKELEAVRLWIFKSAVKTGNVKDDITGEDIGSLLGACLPPAKPLKAVPLVAPPVNEGVQFVMPGYPLKAGVELEQCRPFAYDLSAQVPAEFKDVSRNVMFLNGTRVLQDSASHHMVLMNPNLALSTVPASGWTCAGGARNGMPCSASDLAACGAESVCAGAATPGTLCDITSLLFGGFPAQVANTQSPQEYVPPFEGGVYSELPLKGVLWFNSHAFNLTTEDTTLDARVNFYFAKARKRKLVPSNIVKNQVPAGLAPFTKKTFCSTGVVPQNYSIAMMTGHTHRHGQRFWAKDASGKQIYESFIYNDPIYSHYTPWLEFPGADEKSRTIEFCAEFNNGVKPDGSPDVRLVTRKSRMPPPNATCTPVACTAGKIGAQCTTAVDCDSTTGAKDGECDACPITYGLTTENEMFVLMPWYVLPPD